MVEDSIGDAKKELRRELSKAKRRLLREARHDLKKMQAEFGETLAEAMRDTISDMVEKRMAAKVSLPATSEVEKRMAAKDSMRNRGVTPVGKLEEEARPRLGRVSVTLPTEPLAGRRQGQADHGCHGAG